MEITDVKVKLVRSRSDEKLKAYCTMTFDGEFVVRDIKVIEGTSGYFIAMPSRKVTDRCPECGGKNPLRSKFCSDCGAELAAERGMPDETGRVKLYLDVAHPIHQACRERLQKAAVEAVLAEQARPKEQGPAAAPRPSGGARAGAPGRTSPPPEPAAPAGGDEPHPDDFSSGI
mgnify:CR=1 FL=1